MSFRDETPGVFENPKLAAVLAVLILVVSVAIQTVEAADLYGRVVGVTDGDTVTVLNAGNTQHTIRLFAIDTPETSCHAKKPSQKDDACVERGQPFGKAAKKSLSSMVFGRDVVVSLEKGSTYGRSIGTVFVDGQNANLIQVQRGYAWVYRQYTKGMNRTDQKALFDAEDNAKRQRLGLWADNSPVPPRKWRRSKK